MPHEVIMPALGMAQDKGVLVGWLKGRGDKVKAGEMLMEVETDKATMEVEAGADGYVTELRAAAGDEVPVGDVVAVISETDEGVEAAEPDGKPERAAAEDTPAEAGEAETGRSVIMPALGMSQDTGLIVRWLKQPGDAVAAADPLMEVETDKSTMEVEAGFDGFVVALLAEAGTEVPVGDAVAVIADSPDAKVGKRQPKAAPAPPAEAPPRAASAPPSARAAEPAPAPPAKRPATTHAPGARILASPKARRLAAERGIDLARLVRQGLAQPFHAADLDKLVPEAPAAAPAAARSRLRAEVADAGLAAFRAWAAAEGTAVAGSALWAAFAAAAFRAATGADGPITVRAAAPGAPVQGFTDPDRAALSRLAPGEPDDATLVVRDLSATRVTDATLSADGDLPVLTVARGGAPGTLALTLEAGAGLAPDAAIAFLDDVAGRAETPLRHLL